jgi:hypothetical protein
MGHTYTLVRSLPSMFLRPDADRSGGAALSPKPVEKLGKLSRMFHYQSWRGMPVIMHQMKNDGYHGGRSRVATHALRTVPTPLPAVADAANPDSYSYCPTKASYDGYHYKQLRDDAHRGHHPTLLHAAHVDALAAWMAVSH